jgi:hypothetical protein
LKSDSDLVLNVNDIESLLLNEIKQVKQTFLKLGNMVKESMSNISNE